MVKQWCKKYCLCPKQYQFSRLLVQNWRPPSHSLQQMREARLRKGSLTNCKPLYPRLPLVSLLPHHLQPKATWKDQEELIAKGHFSNLRGCSRMIHVGTTPTPHSNFLTSLPLYGLDDWRGITILLGGFINLSIKLKNIYNPHDQIVCQKWRRHVFLGTGWGTILKWSLSTKISFLHFVYMSSIHHFQFLLLNTRLHQL